MVLLNGPLWPVWAQTAESGQCGFQGFGKTPVNWQVVSLVSTLLSFHDWETGCYCCGVVLHLLCILRGVAALAVRSGRCYVASCRSTYQWGCFTSVPQRASTRLTEWRSHTHAPRFPDGTHPHHSVVIPGRAGWVSETVPVGITVTSVFLSLVVGKGRQLTFNMFALVLRSLVNGKNNKILDFKECEVLSLSTPLSSLCFFMRFSASLHH